MNKKTIADRIKSLVPSGKKAEMARSCHIAFKTFSSYLEGTEPSASKLALLARGLDVNMLWLATGEGPMRPSDNQNVMIQPIMPAAIGDDFILVPRLDVQASAGNGMVALHEEAIDFLAFQANWLRSRNINPAYAQVLTARGDSMEPTIRDGDLLLIDTSITTVRDNALYIVVYDEMVVVKRVHKRLNGSVLLISDNDRYPAEEVSADRVSSLHIAGRVVWFGRTI